MKLQVSIRNGDILPAAMMHVSQRWQCRQVRRRVGVGVEVEEVKIGGGASA
jgi:hypothetical protein